MIDAHEPAYTTFDVAVPGTRLLWLTDDDMTRPDFAARLHELAPAVEQVMYSFSDGEALPEALRACTRLRTLTLSSCHLRALPAWLGELTQLEELRLDNSEYDLWSEWPAELAALQRLRVLSLGSYIQEMNTLSPVVGQLRQLQELTLIGTYSIEDGGVPAQVAAVLGQLRELRQLELPGTVTHELPPAVAALPHLHTLRLNWQQRTFPPNRPDGVLHPLPPQLAQCASLRVLSLQGVYDELPDAIGGLTQLEELELQGQFRELPAAIGQLAGLRRLHIENQFLTSLPATFGQLTGLEELKLRAGLATLPAELGQLQQLRVLDLSNNYYHFSPEGGFPVVPAVLGQLRQLQELNLAHNNVQALPAALGQLTRLQVLDLGENALTEFPPAVLQLRALEHLEVNNNQLTELPDALAELPRLRRLKYSNNQFTSLPPNLEARLRRGEIELLVNYSFGWTSIDQVAEAQATADLLADQFEGHEMYYELDADLHRRLTAPTDFNDYQTALTQLAVSGTIGITYRPIPDDVRQLPEVVLLPLRSPDGDIRQQGILQLFELLHQLYYSYNWGQQEMLFPFRVPDDVAAMLARLHISHVMFQADSEWLAEQLPDGNDCEKDAGL